MEDRFFTICRNGALFSSSRQTAFNHEEAKNEGTIIPSAGVDSEYDSAVDQIKSTKRKLDDYLKEQCRYFGAKVSSFATLSFVSRTVWLHFL